MSSSGRHLTVRRVAAQIDRNPAVDNCPPDRKVGLAIVDALAVRYGDGLLRRRHSEGTFGTGTLIPIRYRARRLSR